VTFEFAAAASLLDYELDVFKREILVSFNSASKVTPT
jgi:hypothetical protein